jgi:hypothetical protein
MEGATLIFRHRYRQRSGDRIRAMRAYRIVGRWLAVVALVQQRDPVDLVNEMINADPYPNFDAWVAGTAKRLRRQLREAE